MKGRMIRRLGCKEGELNKWEEERGNGGVWRKTALGQF